MEKIFLFFMALSACFLNFGFEPHEYIDWTQFYKNNATQSASISNYEPLHSASLTLSDKIILGSMLTAAVGSISYGMYKIFSKKSLHNNADTTVAAEKKSISQKMISLIKKTSSQLGQIGAIYGVSGAAGALYGVVQDQFTYRLCPDYFDKGFHERNMQNWPDLDTNQSLWAQEQLDLKIAKKLLEEYPNNPTLRASVWGVVAGKSQGFLFGIPLILAARVGSWPQLDVKDVIKSLAVSLGVLGLGSGLTGALCHSGVIDFELSSRDIVGVTDLKGFKIDAAIHGAAYALSPIVAMGSILYILKKRYDLAQKNKKDNDSVEHQKQ